MGGPTPPRVGWAEFEREINTVVVVVEREEESSSLGSMKTLPVN